MTLGSTSLQAHPITVRVLEQPARISPTQGRSMRIETTPDEQLLSLIASGSEAALEVFYDRHARAVYSMAHKVLRTTSDCEEVIQDVFVRVWTKAGEYSLARGSVLAWLMTIAHHLSIDLYRRNRLRDADPLDEVMLKTLHSPDLTEQSLDRVLTSTALDSLPPIDRQVLEALYFEGLSQSQLAQRTGLPLGTLKSRARNALQRLRTHFEG